MAFLPIDQDQVKKIKDALEVFTPTLTKVGSHPMTSVPALRISGGVMFISGFTLLSQSSGTTYTYTPTEVAGSYKYYPLYSISASDMQKIYPDYDIDSWAIGHASSIGGSAYHLVRQPSTASSIWNDNFAWYLIKHSNSTYYLCNSILRLATSSSATSLTLPYNIYCVHTSILTNSVISADLI